MAYKITDIPTQGNVPYPAEFLETGSLAFGSRKFFVSQFTLTASSIGQMAAWGDADSTSSGCYCIVVSTDGRGGVYQFIPSSTATPDISLAYPNGFNVVVPNSGQGRWFLTPLSGGIPFMSTTVAGIAKVGSGLYMNGESLTVAGY